MELLNASAFLTYLGGTFLLTWALFCIGYTLVSNSFFQASNGSIIEWHHKLAELGYVAKAFQTETSEDGLAIRCKQLSEKESADQFHQVKHCFDLFTQADIRVKVYGEKQRFIFAGALFGLIAGLFNAFPLLLGSDAPIINIVTISGIISAAITGILTYWFNLTHNTQWNEFKELIERNKQWQSKHGFK